MDIFGFLGYNINDVIPVLKENNINYEITEVDNPKLLRVGNEKRIVNIKNKSNNYYIIYVAYF